MTLTLEGDCVLSAHKLNSWIQSPIRVMTVQLTAAIIFSVCLLQIYY
ncbi:MAG: hypothetical protein ACI9MS_001609 [Glaciecola sp.]|jgi:hypothetical protein